MPNQKRSRLQRKASRVTQTAIEREFNKALGKAVADREQRLKKNSDDYRDALHALNVQRAEQRKKIEDEYKARRDALVEKFVAKEKAVA